MTRTITRTPSRPDLLKGIRIVDLSMGWAGPLATRHLADTGAEILKVESCQHADWWRGWEASQAWIDSHGAEKAVAFNTMNRHKLAVTLDLDNDEGKALCKKLVAMSDAVIANYSGSVLGKLGLDYQDLSKVKEDLIMMSMPAFGATGPWHHYRAYGSTIEQASGMPHLHGHSDWPPTMLHVAYGDPVAGLNAAAALLVALRHKKRTGQGQYIDLSQSECLFPLAAHGILTQAATGEAPVRRGNAAPDMAPHGVFPCAGDDSWITIQIHNETAWVQLQKLAGEALASFGDLADRLARRETLEEKLAAWTCLQDAGELMHKLQSCGVIAAAVLGSGELGDNEHLNARGFWPMLARAHVGELPHPASPFREGPDPYEIDQPAPTLGQHNREVLTRLLGLTDEDLTRLEAARIIGDRPMLAKH